MEGYDKAEPIQERACRLCVIWGTEAVLFLCLKGAEDLGPRVPENSEGSPGTRAQKTGLNGASDAVSQASTHPDSRALHMLHRVPAGQLQKPNRTSP